MPTITSKSTTTDPAVLASSGGEAVHGESSSTTVAAIAGIQLDTADTSSGAGVYGEARGGGAAVVGRQMSPTSHGAGISGECFGNGNAISAIQQNPSSSGAALYAEHATGLTAGYFRGNVIVTGDVSFPGADCAEEFIVKNAVLAEPGTVMALSETGELVPCDAPYDKRVVGVVAGAGSLRSGIVMGRQQDRSRPSQPIALVGTVYCKADARDAPIAVGALLTSAAMPGHAMKASDQTRAFGAVIGKAMAPLHQGLGLIPILIALQ